MGQICTICQHVQADEIDARLLDGEPGRSVARAFGLSEAAVRRHRDNHRPQEGDEEAPGAPELAADAPEDPEPQEDPASVAARLLVAEEDQRRAQRLAELERQERDRRDRAAAQEEREQHLRALRGQADELGHRRRELEEAAEEEMERLRRVLGELSAVDRQHTRVLSRAALLPSGTPLLNTTIQRWVSVRLGDSSPGASFDGYGGSLAQRDPLTPKAPDTRRTQGPHSAA